MQELCLKGSRNFFSRLQLQHNSTFDYKDRMECVNNHTMKPNWNRNLFLNL